MRSSPKSTFPANLPHPPIQLLVDVPLAPAGLDSPRIALSRSAVSIDYFADSAWTDSLPLVVQTALIASFENSGAIAAIDPASIELVTFPAPITVAPCVPETSPASKPVKQFSVEHTVQTSRFAGA